MDRNKKDALIHLKDSHEYMLMATEVVGEELGGLTFVDMTPNSFAWMLREFIEENPVFVNSVIWALAEVEGDSDIIEFE